jgi:hypothetical protein
MCGLNGSSLHSVNCKEGYMCRIRVTERKKLCSRALNTMICKISGLESTQNIYVALKLYFSII